MWNSRIISASLNRRKQEHGGTLDPKSGVSDWGREAKTRSTELAGWRWMYPFFLYIHLLLEHLASDALFGRASISTMWRS
jgi:hypothetical protein